MSPFTAGRINRICYDQTDLERSAGFEPATQEVEAPCSVSTELRAHDGAPGWTRTHIFLSITFVSVRSGGDTDALMVWELKAPSRLEMVRGERIRTPTAKAGGLQPLGLTRVQPSEMTILSNSSPAAGLLPLGSPLIANCV